MNSLKNYIISNIKSEREEMNEMRKTSTGFSSATPTF